MNRLKILLTNENFNARGGAALYMRDVALELQRRGHKPVIFSPELGELAAEVRRATIPVIARLDDLAEPPDVIHGQHALTAMQALLHFSQTPAIYVCHSWEDAPVEFPRVLRYIAVDETCYDHLVSENGIAPDRVKLLLNFADMRRFRSRAPLPQQPERALIFSNGVRPGHGIEEIREACARAGLSVDSLGYGSGSSSAHPETVLPAYDVVFAKARCAIEALAVGCAVVVCDVAGLAGMVTTENFNELRCLHFGRRSLMNPLDPSLIFDAIRRYSAADAERVAKQIRRTASLDAVVDQLSSLYEDVIKEFRRTKSDPTVELRAAASYLGELNLPSRDSDVSQVEGHRRLPALPAVLAEEMVLTPLQALSFKALRATAGQIVAPHNGRQSEANRPEGLMLKTAPLPWQYAAVLPINLDAVSQLAEHAAVLRVRLRVHSGQAGVGILNRDGTAFIARQRLETTSGFVEVLLRTKRLDAVSDLVFHTWDEPEESLIEIRQAEILLAGVWSPDELPAMDENRPAGRDGDVPLAPANLD